MTDEELKRLADEWCATVFAGSDVKWTAMVVAMVGSAQAFALRVADEATRQERERIEGIVNVVAVLAFCDSPKGTVEGQMRDEILRRIKGEER